MAGFILCEDVRSINCRLSRAAYVGVQVSPFAAAVTSVFQVFTLRTATGG